MKVKELIEQLQKADPDTDVSFWIDDGCCGDFIDLEIYDVSIYDYSKPITAALRFQALPGYKSCIQAGGTKRADEKYWGDKNGKK